MNAVVDIYEFSTGIEIKRTAQGWESGGFTGDYMNRTIDPIPKAAIEAIANREFALAEGATLTNPAIVGREVTGYGETWSMLAVVTRGLDDRGRGVSLYRYFLCRGGGYLEAILRWMGSSVRVFDPFEARVMGRSHQVEFSPRPVPLKLEFEALLLMMPPIIIPATEVCTPLVLDRIAQEIAGSDARSWAYQVAALERPEYFQVIYPASASAEAIFRQALANRPAAAAVIAGEASIVSALKALVNNRVKPGSLEVLENACGNPQITEAFWTKLFDKQGAGKAIKESIYGSRNVRLLTLKAILIPRFLPTLLAWLKNSGKSEQYSASLVLQSKILDSFTDFSRACPGLTVMLKRGIGGLLNYLIDKPQVLAEAQFLLTESEGLWFYVWRSLSVELEHDLALMGSHASGNQNLDFQTTVCSDMAIFLGKLQSFWVSPRKRDERFLVLAQLFEEASTSKLAAIFYQFAEGSVPKSVFFRAVGDGQYANVFGLDVDRRMTVVDYVCLFLLKRIDFGGTKMPRFSAILICALVFGVGFGVGYQIQEKTIGNLETEKTNFKTSKDYWEKFAAESHRTKNGIDALKSQLQTSLDQAIQDHPDGYKPDPNSQELITDLDTLFEALLLQVLGLEKDFKLDEIFYSPPSSEQKDKPDKKAVNENWDEFSEAVKRYQKNTMNPASNTADGVIDAKGETIEQLKKDIEARLNPPALERLER
jgi:hypothetical protein